MEIFQRIGAVEAAGVSDEVDAVTESQPAAPRSWHPATCRQADRSVVTRQRRPWGGYRSRPQGDRGPWWTSLVRRPCM